MAYSVESGYPALGQFMGCYWMETADLVYGDITGAVNAFLQIEPPSLISALEGEIRRARHLGMLVDRPAPSSDEERFWQQFGARSLTSQDAQLICMMLQGQK
jgi:hypothetical protein